MKFKTPIYRNNKYRNKEAKSKQKINFKLKNKCRNKEVEQTIRQIYKTDMLGR